MKIKSKTDVITNSSDETYIIKTDLTEEEAKVLFYEYMEKNHHEEWNNTEWRFLEPDLIYRDNKKGSIIFEWSILCNLDDAYGYLCDVFGKEFVKNYEEF